MKASKLPPGSELMGPPFMLGIDVGNTGLRGTNETVDLVSSVNLFNGGLLNVGSDPQNSAAGIAEGEDCAVPLDVFLSDTEPCFLGTDPAPRLEEGSREPG